MSRRDHDVWPDYEADRVFDEDDYGLLALALGYDGAPADFVEMEPIDRLTSLIQWADRVSLGEHLEPEAVFLYRLAAGSVVDPLVQLELGSLFLLRASVDESPLSDHQYIGKEFNNFEPRAVIWELVSAGPPASDSDERVQLIELALGAFERAWRFYAYRRESTNDLARSLFALDGLRVCYWELNLPLALSSVCSGLRIWLDGSYRAFKHDGDLDELVREIEKRFAKTEGQLKPLIDGHREARARLLADVDWFDLLPISVREYLVDGDYEIAQLRDPSYKSRAPVASFSIAVEEMLRLRVGQPMDASLERLNPEHQTAFRKNFLGRGPKLCAGLQIGQWKRNLEQPKFRGLMAAVGADSKFIQQELRYRLAELVKLRNQASHPAQAEFTGELTRARRLALEIIGEVQASTRLALESDDTAGDARA